MVKPKSKTRKKARKRSEKVAPSQKAVRNAEGKHSVDQLLDKTEEFMERLDFNTARLFCERALQINPEHPRALEITGNILLEAGQPEKAMQCYQQAIALEPEKGDAKYLNLAQLSEGLEAVQLFNKGIEILAKAREESQSDAEKLVLNSKISSAYCSIAEVYLTDLCFEDDAELACETSVKTALEYDPANFEAYQIYSSFLLSANKLAESKLMLEKSLQFWFKAPKEEDQDSTEDPRLESPAFPLRVAAAKLLMEHQEHKRALQILETLLEEDDEEIELWYLIGTCYFSLYQQQKSMAEQETIQEQTKMESTEHFVGAIKLLVKLNIENENMYFHIMSMVKKLGYTGDETQFDLKHIKSTLQNEIPSCSKVFVQENRAGDTLERKIDFDEESLTLSDKEFIGEFNEPDDENGATSSNTVSETEKMEE